MLERTRKSYFYRHSFIFFRGALMSVKASEARPVHPLLKLQSAVIDLFAI